MKAIPTGGYIPREVGSQVGRDLAAGSVRSQHSYGLNREHDHEPHASSETGVPEIPGIDPAQVV